MMNIVCVISSVVVIALLNHKVQSLTCLHCESISHPRFCNVVSHCNSGEVCYTESLIDVDGTTVYNSGCTSKQQMCNATTQASGSPHCLECCNNDLCNSNLCGDHGYPHQRGPVCYSCRSHLLNEPCHIIKQCQLDEVCSFSRRIVFSEFTYTSGCSFLHACESHNHVNPGTIIGKRAISELGDGNSLGGCHQCCVSDLCNSNCSSIKDTNSCVPTPCKHGGTCLESDNGYLCTCSFGFTGQHCDNGPCASSPCINGGTCIDNQDGYVCTCTYGFSGQKCEIDKPLYSCLDLQQKEHINQTGVYRIVLPYSKQHIQVVCDMQTDGGGWTVFQQRFNGSVDFNQNFSTYENGFGNLDGEFWLGLGHIYELTKACSKVDLRIDLETGGGRLDHRLFNNFSLSPPPRYTLNIHETQYEGHGLMYHNGSDFYTNDYDTNGCAANEGGGWWYKNCAYVNLNAKYGSSNMEYRGFNYFPLKTTKMMLRGDKCT